MRYITSVLLALLLTATSAMAVSALEGEWSVAADIEAFESGAHPDFNTAALEGCPNISRDGKTFFIASDRPGGQGGLDIWVSTRARERDPWGPPVNVGPPVNTAANDFCPTMTGDGSTFYFVSTRPGHCGDAPNADIYTAQRLSGGTFTDVTHLGCGVNSGADEHSPFPVPIPGGARVLFFSSARSAGAGDAAGDHDLYQSMSVRGVYQPATQIAELNTESQDGQPNVRRDGLELFFYSNRPGAAGNDIYSSSRASTSDPWGAPVNLGPGVNSPAAETRPSLSADGSTLYFGSTRNGSSDIYVTTREVAKP